ncbi:MAG: PDDEXK nuclease domain-containing protein [Bacteroidales bacterium]|jgi:predicted nuclease of restriction endonuclease-like (RecB) superfamily|nr:PDDEXK nuclease domain-containing protein [Bacteroidales bacterium]
MVKSGKDNKNIIALSKSEDRFFVDVLRILNEGRNKAHAAVNFAMVETYWNIGRRIVEQEQQGKKRAKYGEQLLVNLSRYLGSAFGKGFSVANLWNFRQFYLTWSNEDILYTMCRELSWSHIRLIMRLDDKKIREYYLNETRAQGWSVRVLERNIQTNYFKRLVSSQKSLPVTRQTKAFTGNDFIKDPYVLEFLKLPEKPIPKETTLETAIIDHLQEFLLEMGRGFSFVGRQFRISTETTHFYIDLVFYNYLLKCFVVIDLKTKKLMHQDIGQMDMYVRMFDDLKRGDGDNPTIGIILCTDKDKAIAKYSVLSESRQIFASRYKLILPTEEELIAELERNTRQLCEIQSNDNPSKRTNT